MQKKKFVKLHDNHANIARNRSNSLSCCKNSMDNRESEKFANLLAKH